MNQDEKWTNYVKVITENGERINNIEKDIGELYEKITHMQRNFYHIKLDAHTERLVEFRIQSMISELKHLEMERDDLSEERMNYITKLMDSTISKITIYCGDNKQKLIVYSEPNDDKSKSIEEIDQNIKVLLDIDDEYIKRHNKSNNLIMNIIERLIEIRKDIANN